MGKMTAGRIVMNNPYDAQAGTAKIMAAELL